MKSKIRSQKGQIVVVEVIKPSVWGTYSDSWRINTFLNTVKTDGPAI